jgi:hypothetical protein
MLFLTLIKPPSNYDLRAAAYSFSAAVPERLR